MSCRGVDSTRLFRGKTAVVAAELHNNHSFATIVWSVEFRKVFKFEENSDNKRAITGTAKHNNLHLLALQESWPEVPNVP